MLQAVNHEDAWIFVHEVVVSFIINKGGTKENYVVKQPPEGASQLVYQVLRFPWICWPHDEGVEGQLSWVHLYVYTYDFCLCLSSLYSF